MPNPNAEKANAQRGKSLEVLLASKNKRILEQLTKFRVCYPQHLFHVVFTRRLQVLHGELEASLMNARSDLEATSAELEKQRALNDKLENDLLQLETHKPKNVNGDATPAEDDVLAGLDLGKKSTVSNSCISTFIQLLNTHISDNTSQE